MTDYKKEAPDIEEGNPSTIEHYLAEIIDIGVQLLEHDSYGQKVGDIIINLARKAWDLVDSDPKVECYNCNALVTHEWVGCPFCGAPGGGLSGGLGK